MSIARSVARPVSSGPIRGAGEPPTRGPELITNSTFDTNVDGWLNAGGGVPTWVAPGRLQIQRVSSANNRVATLFPIVSGRSYEVLIGYAAVTTAPGSPTWRIGTTATGSDVVALAVTTGGTVATFTAAVTADVWLNLGITANGLAEFDDISIREILA